jgi:uncharacterized protein (DUF2236 family)
MLWVHATLVHVALSVYRRFVRQLSPAEEEAFYRQMALVAQLVGTPAEVIPSTLADFGAYMRSQLDGEELSVTAPAREVAAVILEPSLPAPVRPLLPVHRLATAGLLPARLRREYGLPWSRSRELALELGARSVRSLALPLFGAAQRSVPVRTQSVSESLFA